MQKLVLVVAILGLVVCEKTLWHQLNDYTFSKYLVEHRKQYAEGEHEIRRQIFESNLAKIQAHNADPSQTYKLGVNHMTDWTPKEFKRLLGYKKGADAHLEKPLVVTESVDLSALPDRVDWREAGIISAVKDQGLCGSCWTFGTAEVIESHWAKATGQLNVLSEQQILDCVPNPNQCGGTGGCGGGTPELAMDGIIKKGGLSSEWTYPYISYYGNNGTCGRVTPMAKLSGYKVLEANSYSAVMNAVATVGPLAINVDASAWQFYESGVFNGCNQDSPDIDHVVQLVGYGSDKKFGDYWLVRNSWNPTWGDAGYIRLQRSADQKCGWDVKPSDGTGCNKGPDRQWVCGTCGITFDVSYPIVAK